MARLANKTVLITGGTSGIGLAAARRCVAEGARVAVTGSDPGRPDAARAELGSDVLTIRADAGDVGAQRTVAEAVGAAFGRPDAAVLNAGVGTSGRSNSGTRRVSTARSASTSRGRSSWYRRCCPSWPIPRPSC